VSAGHTYTTITSGPGKPARIDVLVYPDEAARIRVCGLDDGTPQLWISYGDVDVTFLPTLGPVTATDARIARDLAAKAAAYAAAVERLHTEPNPQATTAA